MHDLPAARALRDSVHALFTAAVTGTAAPAAAVAHVNTVAAAAPTAPQLAPVPTGGFTAAAPATTTGDTALLGDLAGACIGLLTGDRAALLRRCDGPGCCLFFVQHHPRRRFCHESCAHLDRQARYYRRHR